MPVLFHSEKSSFTIDNEEVISNWIRAVLSHHGAHAGDINIIFVNNEYILELNKKYLKHNYYTDVITFEYSEGKVISGDVFISVDQVLINSQIENVTFYNELFRVIIHGILHLLGYNDQTDEEKAVIRDEENLSLRLLENFDHGKDI